MTTITFQGRAYTPEVLATMTIQELTDLHNTVAALDGGEEVWVFADDRAAQEATWAMLSGGETAAPPPTIQGSPTPRAELDEFDRAAPVRPAEKGKRKMLFRFPTEREIKPPKAGTLRHTVLEAMRRGVTYKDVIGIVREFDGIRGVGEKNTERRAYEVIRLLHYYCGYGMDQDASGVIRVKE